MSENSVKSILWEVGLLKRVDIKAFDGFTLAEVLITLVIIGVIAAMTIPTLMNKTNNQELVSKLKKTYSTLSQATNKIIADEGNPQADMGGWATSVPVIAEMYKKYLVNTRACTNGMGKCLAVTYRNPDGNVADVMQSAGNNIVLADGAVIAFWDTTFSDSCSTTRYGTGGVCEEMIVDINGAKGPNVIGKDTFAFDLTPNGLIPAGCSSGNCPTGGGTSSWSCTCRALRQGSIDY